jgi:hypothetical protein
MRKSTLLLALLVLALPLAARAQEGMAGAAPSFTAMAKETKTFKIIAIDKSTRVVTVLAPKGDTLDVECGEEVKNFAQLKVGDEVKTTYTESFTIHVEGSGEAEASSETMTSRAKPGEMPSASITERATAKATIKAIDKAKGTATLQAMNGEQFTVTADDKANLEKVQVGNVVVVTYTVGHAISVSKPKPAKTSSKSKG